MKEIGFICATIRDEMKRKQYLEYLQKNWITLQRNYLKSMVLNLLHTEYDFPGYTCISLNYQGGTRKFHLAQKF